MHSTKHFRHSECRVCSPSIGMYQLKDGVHNIREVRPVIINYSPSQEEI